MVSFKQYFTRYKSKLPEYVDMKRIAIRKMYNDCPSYKKIAEVIGISPQAVSKLHKKQDSINEDVEDLFHIRIARGHYPMFDKKRIVWKRV
jgi:transcriptional regulator with XRE-family HTH domain